MHLLRQDIEEARNACYNNADRHSTYNGGLHMNHQMSLKEAVSSVFRHYADFQGRARRSEYWYFCLFNFLIYMLVYFVYFLIAAAGFAGMSYGSLLLAWRSSSLLYLLYGIYSLAVIIPALAVGCRRLHDTGRPGTLLLLGLIPLVGAIILLVWFVQEGESGPNQYGPDPKGGAAYYAAAPVYRDSYGSARQNNTPRYDAYGHEPRSSGTSGLWLEGTAGWYSGKRIPVRGTMVAGRDPGCSIGFPGDTHGVSHRHCQIRANGSTLIVTDLGSSYGTFINGKNRLKPQHSVAVSPGDSIALGSQKQCFTVRS